MLRMLWWLGRPLPVERASLLGARFMAWLGPKTGKQAQVMANLRVALPDKSEREIAALARESWANVGAVLAEYARLDELTAAGGRPFIETVVRGDSAGLADRGVPCIFVTAHLGNWELAAFVARQLKGPLELVYNPQKNPLLEKMVQQQRSVLDCRFISKVNALRGMLKALKNGRSVGLLVDYRVDGGKLVPFFGVDAETTPAPAWLSLKTGCAIVPVQVERREGARFRVTLHEQLRVEPREGETDEQAVDRVTTEINDIVAGWIRARPGQWLCSKRRWPKPAMKTFA